MQFIVSPFQWMELNGLDFSGLWWNDAPHHASMKLSVMIWKTFPSKFTQALFAKGAYRMSWIWIKIVSTTNYNAVVGFHILLCFFSLWGEVFWISLRRPTIKYFYGTVLVTWPLSLIGLPAMPRINTAIFKIRNGESENENKERKTGNIKNGKSSKPGIFCKRFHNRGWF